MKCIFAAVAALAVLPVMAGTLIIARPPEAPISPPKGVPLNGANSPMVAAAGATDSMSNAPPKAPPIAPPKVARSWDVRSEDINFANVFTRWGREAGYAVRWDARKNAVVEGPDRIGGSFEDAVTYVLSGPGISTSSYPLEVCFYPNTPPLARITRKGEQDKECK